jgi:hypothetical protein
MQLIRIPRSTVRRTVVDSAVRYSVAVNAQDRAANDDLSRSTITAHLDQLLAEHNRNSSSRQFWKHERDTNEKTELRFDRAITEELADLWDMLKENPLMQSIEHDELLTMMLTAVDLILEQRSTSLSALREFQQAPMTDAVLHEPEAHTIIPPTFKDPVDLSNMSVADMVEHNKSAYQESQFQWRNYFRELQTNRPDARLFRPRTGKPILSGHMPNTPRPEPQKRAAYSL